MAKTANYQLPPMAGVDANFLRELNARLLLIASAVGTVPAAAAPAKAATVAAPAVAGVGQATAQTPIGDTPDPPVHYDATIEDLRRQVSGVDPSIRYDAAIEDLRRLISAVDAAPSTRPNSISPVFLEDTLAHLSSYPAAGYPQGSTYYASDTRAFYVDVSISGTPTWEAASGVLIEDTAANISLYAAANYPRGSVFYATDTSAYSMDVVVSSVATWVSIGSSGSRYSGEADASGALTLSLAWQDVPGCTLTLGPAGTYLIFANVAMETVAGDGTCSVQLVAGGVGQTGQIQVFNSGVLFMSSRQWLYTAGAAGVVVKLQAQCAVGPPSGSSYLMGGITNIAAIQI